MPVVHVHFKVRWRVSKGLGLFRLTSAQPLIGSTIRKFSKLCVWLLKVICCLYRHSFYEIDHSTLCFWVFFRTVVAVQRQVSECGEPVTFVPWMKLTASKTKTMEVSISRTMHHLSPPLTIGGTVLKDSD